MAGALKETVKGALLGGKDDDSPTSSQTQAVFDRHAVQDPETGERYMGQKEFIDAVAPQSEDYRKIPRDTYSILFEVADRHRKGRVSLDDWASFYNILLKPDAEYEMAYRLFADPATGMVDFESFKDVYSRNRAQDAIPFDWNSEWASLYIGGKKRRHSLTYHQFSQMLRGLQGERIRQAFQYLDTNKSGYISPDDFSRIIRECASHKLSDHLLSNLSSLCNISNGTKISYANVRAFQNVLNQMDLVELIVRHACAASEDGKVTRTDFLNAAARLSRFSIFTPMEADILFHFASLDEPSGRLSLNDFSRVLDPSYAASASSYDSRLGAAGDAAANAIAKSSTLLKDILTSVHHFALGSIAGAFGAFMVYPIDLVKTRMQNQRSARVGQLMYTNSIDCFQKVLKNEGVKGLYSGVLPQLVGVAPEKAIKLTVNDLVRGKFSDPKTGSIKLWAEILAGGSAGACQVIFTNPLEIVKIRLQVQGEVAKQKGVERRSAMWIVRNLGLKGLYKGASACLLRDVPFSAIYFPAYNHLKRDFFGESQTKKLGVVQLLTAGAIAGMPAAYLTTPCDVIKTRLQVEARKGDTTYTSLRHCAKTILQEEGFKAFFKGGPARIFRSSPQFGFTLAGYEVLQNLLPMPGQHDGAAEAAPRSSNPLDPAAGMGAASAPLPYLRSRNALKIILDLDLGFGRARIPEPSSSSSSSSSFKSGIFGFGGKSKDS